MDQVEFFWKENNISDPVNTTDMKMLVLLDQRLKRFTLTGIVKPILAELKNKCQFSNNQDKENGKV